MSTEILSHSVIEAGPSVLVPQFATDLPFLSQAADVAKSFNVYGEFSLKSLERPLVDRRKAGEVTFNFLDKDWAVPAYVSAVEDTRSQYFGGTFQSREEYQNSIATHAQVQTSVGFFSGEMEASYSHEFQSNSQYAYAYKDFVSELARLDFDPGPGLYALSDDFLAAVQALPGEVDPGNLLPFVLFFETFGGYYTRRITLGGSLRFSVSVQNSSQLTKDETTAMMKAQYDGLFTSGSIEADIKTSRTWQAYSASSRTEIRAMGGSPSAIAALVGVQPLDPSEETVAAFQAWVHSLETAPAVCDFVLEEIWKLCGDKAGAVREAWRVYTDLLHTRVTIRTLSTPVPFHPWPPQPPVQPMPPAITLKKAFQPTTPPDEFAGFQLLILEREGSVDEPFKVRLDRYYTVALSEPWAPVYSKIYQEIERDLRDVLRNGDLVVLASFGIDYNMVPPHGMLSLLQSIGAGATLEHWLETSQGGYESNGWIGIPANYALVGIAGNGPNTGIERLNNSYYGQPPVLLSLDAYLYRDSLNGRFTLGLGA